jgi:hypothetical protein
LELEKRIMENIKLRFWIRLDVFVHGCVCVCAFFPCT